MLNGVTLSVEAEASTSISPMAWLILLIVAWGALAFGAIYEWARWPLLVACAAAGAIGFTREVPRERRGVNGPILLGLVLVALAVGVQLVPLESLTIRRWSPATHEFLKQYDIRYALPTIGDASPDRLRQGYGASAEALRAQAEGPPYRGPV
jgi:hypothetical protein